MFRLLATRNFSAIRSRYVYKQATSPVVTAFCDRSSITPFSNVHHNQQHSRRLKSSLEHKSLASWQKECWMSYLASSLGSDNLFHAIDSDHDNFIATHEIKQFLDNVDHKGVHPRAFKMLDEIAHDHAITNAEFKSWLALATKFGNQRNFSFSLDYQTRNPEGVQRRTRNAEDDDDNYRSWNETTMSQSIRRMQYAVRGQIVMRADELKAQGRNILFTNIGNPQAVGQAPITFFRQVLALTDLPKDYGVEHPEVESMFPADVIRRAKDIHHVLNGAGTGAYTGSQGAPGFREDVANFIQNRDGHPAYSGDIFLTNGASTAIEMTMGTLVSNELDGIMIPIPQYPLYSALIAKLGARQVGYELDEENSWAAPKEELERRLHDAQADGTIVKALAIINPGNPTGQVLSREDLEVICKFCAENGIVLLADEVYQRNVYAPDKKFLSAKKVALETQGCENLQLVSFHSTSKGFIGECGRRGGYMELYNIDKYVQSQLYKVACSRLCSNVPGQITTSLMVNPPQPGDESYDLFVQEENEIFKGLKRRSEALVEGLNAVDGITCNPVEGAMYAFPSITIPSKAVEYSDEHDMTPDTLYALSLLDETGVCVVPASGFGQKEGRYGFRTTFLPPDDQMLPAIELFASHHRNFCKKFG